MLRPAVVWMVAPVVMPTGGASGSRVNSYRLISMARPTRDSNKANWSPMHLRRPPPKGRYAKPVVTSLGIGSSMGNLSGLKVSGSFHRSGLRCRFHTLMKMSEPFSTTYSSNWSSSRARLISTGGWGYSLMDSLMTRVVNLRAIMSSTVTLRSPTTASTSARTRAAMSGCSASRYMVQVSTAAVVSWPAINMVIRSSRSCLLLISSPLASRKCRMEGSRSLRNSSPKSASSSSTSFLHLSIKPSSVPFTILSASTQRFWRGTSTVAPGRFQYAMGAVERCSASRSTVYTAWMTGSSCVRESKS
mmetsp:Transcript_5389/g.11861  ORF Transcript_5389/g.11861 Transcript_5389/m.11861 type:complete len:303 (-) Transcript_5389:872-1780(-)